MAQDTTWTGNYLKAIETERNDTSYKQIRVTTDTAPFSEGTPATGGRFGTAPIAFFLFIIFIIVANILYKRRKKDTSINNTEASHYQ